MNTPEQKPEADNPATDDSFPDLSKLRLSQEFLETAGAKKILTTVPVHKPGCILTRHSAKRSQSSS
jgi:hypothetical protein